MLLAEVLKVSHVDHHEAKRTAKPMPIAMAVRMSGIDSFMGLLLKTSKLFRLQSFCLGNDSSPQSNFWIWTCRKTRTMMLHQSQHEILCL
jgi:hypothetical protein